MKSRWVILSKISVCCFLLGTGSCSTSNHRIQNPARSAPAALQQDLTLLNKALQKYHPSLYAYCPKEEWDMAVRESLESIQDSMNDADFAYRIVGPLIARIRCGHTSASLSNRYKKYQQMNPPGGFPLLLKFFGDTMMVARNLHRADSQIRKGTIIHTINGLDSRNIRDRMFMRLPMDGYAESVNMARLNNNFPFYHRMVMGIDSVYYVQYQDGLQNTRSAALRAYHPAQQSKPVNGSTSTSSGGKKLTSVPVKRDLQIDTISNVAYMFLANFDRPLTSHQFIRKSFKTIKRHDIKHLIIDLRTNGGGVIDNEVYLARHLRKNKFRVADSAVAINRNFSGFRKYFRNDWINSIIMHLFTREDEQGLFHMSRYWEQREFKPVRRRFFNGQVYILTGGMTFSAASLFCKTMKGQDNVLLIGEETGGSGYASNGLLIPDFRLPNSGVKVRMPLFRLVPDSSASNNGRGVMPDIRISPTSTSFKLGFDPVMVTALSVVRQFDQKRSHSADLK